MNAQLLEKLCQEKKITESQLASILNVNVNTIAQWKNNTLVPDEDTFDLLCLYFQVPPEELMCENELNEIESAPILPIPIQSAPVSNLPALQPNQVAIFEKNGQLGIYELDEVQLSMIRNFLYAFTLKNNKTDSKNNKNK